MFWHYHGFQFQQCVGILFAQGQPVFFKTADGLGSSGVFSHDIFYEL
jgi:hypothetical protein